MAKKEPKKRPVANKGTSEPFMGSIKDNEGRPYPHDARTLTRSMVIVAAADIRKCMTARYRGIWKENIRLQIPVFTYPAKRGMKTFLITFANGRKVGYLVEDGEDGMESPRMVEGIEDYNGC